MTDEGTRVMTKACKQGLLNMTMNMKSGAFKILSKCHMVTVGIHEQLVTYRNHPSVFLDKGLYRALRRCWTHTWQAQACKVSYTWKAFQPHFMQNPHPKRSRCTGYTAVKSVALLLKGQGLSRKLCLPSPCAEPCAEADDYTFVQQDMRMQQQLAS